MVNEDQAKADLKTEETPVVDPLDAANSQIGTNELDAYEAEREAMLADLDAYPTQGQEPAEEQQEERQQDDDAVSEEEAEEQSEETSEEDEDEPEAKAPKRIRVSRPEDIAIAAIAKAKDISFAEATDIFRGLSTTKHPDQEAEQTTASETVQSVSEEIKQLQAQKREALKNLEFEDFTDIENRLDALRDRREELKFSEAQAKARADKDAESEYYSKYGASEAKALGFYPDAGVKDSPMAKEMARLEAEMLEMGDDLYHSPDKPLILAKEAAKNLGIPMKKPGPAPVQKTVQRRPFNPASGDARTTSADSNQAFDQKVEGLTTLDAYEEEVRRMTGRA